VTDRAADIDRWLLTHVTDNDVMVQSQSRDTRQKQRPITVTATRHVTDSLY